MKEKVAEAIAARVADGEVIGVGTGSTVDLALEMLGRRISQERLHVQVVPTSHASAWRCQQLGLTVLFPAYRGELAWGFDGADEVDPGLRLIKGRGGAMLKEKILAAKCKKFIVIVDESKLVKRLGEKYPVPVEVIPEARSVVERGLQKLGAKEITLRTGTGIHGPSLTESGNIIIDATFSDIPDSYDREIKSIVGVVEHGLFFSLASEVIVGGANGIRTMRA